MALDELYKKKYRYWKNGRTGISDSDYAHAYQASTSTTTNPPAAPISSSGTTGLVSQTVDYSTGQTKTSWGGVPAYRIDINSGPINVVAGQEMANPIDVTETGVLIGWTVAVNSPSMQVTSIIYGDNGTQTTLWDDTVEAVTYLGRGLTHSQALATAPGQYPYSMDFPGVKDDIWPWIRRYRSTPSLNALQNGLTYTQYAGTKDDIWIVLDYTPAIKEGYSRVSLSVTNGGSSNALITKLQMSRIKFQPSVTPVYTSASGDFAQIVDASFSDELVD